MGVSATSMSDDTPLDTLRFFRTIVPDDCVVNPAGEIHGERVVRSITDPSEPMRQLSSDALPSALPGDKCVKSMTDEGDNRGAGIADEPLVMTGGIESAEEGDRLGGEAGGGVVCCSPGRRRLLTLIIAGFRRPRLPTVLV